MSVTGPSLLIVSTVSSTIRQFLRPFATHARAAGWRVSAAASGATDDPALLDDFDQTYELPLSRSLVDARALISGYRAMSRLLSEARPDLLHVHTPIASFLARLAVRRMPRALRPAVVYTAHGFHAHRGGNPLVNAVFVTAERVAGRWTDRLVVMNDEDEAAARRQGIVPGRRLMRMPGIGIDTGWFSPSFVSPAMAVEVRDRLSIPAWVPVFVVVAELSRRKRQADAIAAVAASRHPDARLVLLGDGPTRSALEGIARDLGVADRVVFAGSVGDVRPFLAAATALVLTSDREGLARSIMEALSMEIPVVASDARGNAELVGDSGFVVPIGDIRALARALDWMAEHPDERRAMGARGRSRMVERYELRLVIDLHDRLYGDLLIERRRRQSGHRPP